jgi:Arc/MetJ family transcription regulator
MHIADVADWYASRVTRTMLDLDDDLLARAARELGTTTKKDTVHAALRAALRASAAQSLIERMAENNAGVEDEALVNDMWRGPEAPA